MNKSLIYSAIVALPLLAGCNSSSDDTPDEPSDGIFGREGSIIEFLATPYLQNPATDGMTVMLEPTVEGGRSPESTVFYREQGNTGPYTPVTSMGSEFDELGLVQRARINGLKSDTKYDYFVRTSYGDSKVYNFRTWPTDADINNNNEYTFVAMSDTHASDRDRFGEGLTGLRDIYEHGIIKHECLDDITTCNDLVAGIIVAGDLVYASNARKAYRDFFNSSHELAAYIPVLPTPGNHEHDGGNIEAYDIYLDWPEQMGWHKARYTYSLDFLNLRLFFFDSFVKTDGGQEYQYDWTMEELEKTTNDASIDYVLGVTHAPCKSSMWLSGESWKSCDFVGLLHDYSEQSGKISGHMFGHTHAYTRGNDKNVPHVALNVATSVGRIDHFAEFAQKDYDSVAVSNDSNGYNIFTLKAAGEKQMTMTRRTGGSFYRGIDLSFPVYETQVYKMNNGPDQPIFERFEFTGPGVISLAATDFQGLDGTEHYETHWQVSTSPEFEDDVSDIWGNTTRAYNWWYNETDFLDEDGNRIHNECNPYADKDEECEGLLHTFAVDTQEGVDITQYETTTTTAPGSTIYARVRYRDNNLNWSEWSTSESLFYAGVATDNVVINGDAEAGDEDSWTHRAKTDTGAENALRSLPLGACGIPDARGERVFQLGNLGGEDCNGYGYGFGGVAYQDVNVFDALEDYTGNEPLYATYSAYMMNWGSANDDPIWLYVAFLDEGGNIIGESEHIKANSPKVLTKYMGSTLAPEGTHSVRVVLESDHQSGTDTDAQFDDVELILSMPK
ncbi:metallophosphoesterase [Photobacterium minamisatsumaniensis]|uniref:metallophosphoesterase n=1 Tax=Photobacterium minamisatsumaniensis TaxID=2910233 RepID=UPI003D0A77E7